MFRAVVRDGGVNCRSTRGPTRKRAPGTAVKRMQGFRILTLRSSDRTSTVIHTR
jgi:hypothetical protein